MKVERINVPMLTNGVKRRREITLEYDNGRIFVTAPYNKDFVLEIKAMQGAKWHGFDESNPRKVWSVANTARNMFQFKLMQFEAMDAAERKTNPQLNPYYRYDLPLMHLMFERPLREHQKTMTSFVLTRHYCELAAEMGLGKSLSAIEAAERALVAFRAARGDYETADQDLVWYVGPHSGVKAVGRELVKWRSQFVPRMLTYEGLVKEMKNWKDGYPAPFFIIFDEASKVKTPTAQRSQCSKRIADAVREEWGDMGFIVELTGTPTPKSPVDYWNQAEIACPGFLREGDIHKFKQRLCLIEQKENLITGGAFPSIKTWWDDERKCAICGEYEDSENHHFTLDALEAPNGRKHPYKKSVNEVDLLYKRLNGLVLVMFKKDCLDLPEKSYEVIRLKPTIEMINAMKIIKAKTSRAVQVLTLCRELSDGFQYVERETGEETCKICNGRGHILAPVPVSEDVDPSDPHTGDYTEQEVICDNCGGTGQVTRYTRDIDSVKSPKDDYLVDDLDEHEEIGRYIAWAGFTGSIDRIVAIVHQQGWSTLRVDGRGYIGSDCHGNPINSDELLDAMDRSNPRFKELMDKHPLVCFVGHPQAGGMALTLTASPTALYYSNCFDGEARFQSEDRGHRMGMDANRGYMIKDLVLLPTDQIVLDNLKKKRKLQDMSMGELDRILQEESENEKVREYSRQ